MYSGNESPTPMTKVYSYNESMATISAICPQASLSWSRKSIYIGVEVPCLLTFYHRDTRVVQKAKELVARKFVIA